MAVGFSQRVGHDLHRLLNVGRSRPMDERFGSARNDSGDSDNYVGSSLPGLARSILHRGSGTFPNPIPSGSQESRSTKAPSTLAQIVEGILTTGFICLGVYLWAKIFGEGSLRNGFRVLGTILLFALVVSLPRKPTWSRLLKGITLCVAVFWSVRASLPTATQEGWFSLVLVNGFVAFICYVVLFEDFIN